MDTQEQSSISYLPLEETMDWKPKSEKLTIGIPKENTFQENRVPLIPTNVSALVNQGHTIIIESKAGEGSNYYDIDFSEAGAKIVYNADEVYEAQVILKAAPISDEEIPKLKMNQIIISPIHVSAMKKEHLDKMRKKQIIAMAFELIKDDSGNFPIVRSMSEIAGNASILIGAEYLSTVHSGKGILLGGISGVPPAKIVILGAGVVGEFAARTALGLGAEIKIFDDNTYRLMRLQNNLGVRCFTSVLDNVVLEHALKTADVLVTALKPINGLIPPVITEEHVSNMKAGSVIIDVNIDRGGACETSEVRSHAHPTFKKYDVVHYCVPNIPSRIPRTASIAISHVLMPLISQVSQMGGFENYLWNKANIRESIYLYKGHLTNLSLSKKFGIKYTDLNIFMPYNQS